MHYKAFILLFENFGIGFIITYAPLLQIQTNSNLKNCALMVQIMHSFFYLYALTMVRPFLFIQLLSLFWSHAYTFTTSTYIMPYYYDVQPSVFIYWFRIEDNL